jgi:hypothetical protein
VTRTTAVFGRGPAEEFLLARGAGQRPHPGGTLHEHLLRVADLLAEWGADRHLQAAGLCHACYGTDGYDQPLLALAERPVLAALIGARAESLVYLYGSCDRTAVYPLLPGPGPVPFRDRFTGRTVAPPEPDVCAFTELTAANELDIMRHNPAMAAQHGSALLQLLTRARARLTDAAWQAWKQLSAASPTSLSRTPSPPSGRGGSGRTAYASRSRPWDLHHAHRRPMNSCKRK